MFSKGNAVALRPAVRALLYVALHYQRILPHGHFSRCKLASRQSLNRCEGKAYLQHAQNDQA